ncbi:hypothetical protein QC761_609793 [Podospora bellae-mahoneyi]|uniref:Uncharacterized protein n=1 Tax=Podospora bellae-mahoneyi TaxID=2093777 RepID=A0ABR0FBJ7_9PEZI|nr:hypothetical protein QC761_609793 [Podospora bellae-mahoneyi]
MAPKRHNNKAPKAPKAPKNHKTTSKFKKVQAPITTRVTRSRARESGEELVSLDITAVTNTTVTTEIKVTPSKAPGTEEIKLSPPTKRKASTETPRDLESLPRKLARNGRAPKSPSSPKKTPTEKQVGQPPVTQKEPPVSQPVPPLTQKVPPVPQTPPPVPQTEVPATQTEKVTQVDPNSSTSSSGIGSVSIGSSIFASPAGSEKSDSTGGISSLNGGSNSERNLSSPDSPDKPPSDSGSDSNPRNRDRAPFPAHTNGFLTALVSLLEIADNVRGLKQTIDETPGVSPNWADSERYSRYSSSTESSLYRF